METCRTPGCGSSDFGRDKRFNGGLSPFCKACRAAAVREYRKLRPDVPKRADKKFRDKPANKEKRRKWNALWRSRNPDGCLARSEKWNNSEAGKDYFARYKYGISLVEYREWFKRAGGKCAACGCTPAPTRRLSGLFLDHNHKTKRVRGVLCHHCNSALGLLKDSLECIDKLRDYLAKTD